MLRVVCAVSIIWGMMCNVAVAESPTPAAERDWPTWRHDAARSATSPMELPTKLHLQWVRQYPPARPAWKDAINRDRMGYDTCHNPVAAGATMVIGFSASDKVVALDTRSGKEKWRFYTAGPVRLPPTIWRKQVYFVSDDGFLYCLDLADGALKWRHRGGPGGRLVLGNERLISAWPARGGAVVADDVVYFGASIWPFMGTFIYGLAAETGEAVWVNDGTGSAFLYQPHGSPAFAGPAPQGALTVAGDKLLVPNGRSAPAVFDRKTGQMLYYRLAESQKTGGAGVAVMGKNFLNWRGLGADVYDLASGEARGGSVGKLPVVSTDACFFGGRGVVARTTKLKRIEYEKKVRIRKTKEWGTVTKVRWEMPELWRCQVDARGCLIRSGSRLYAGADGAISVISIPAGRGRAEVISQLRVKGKVVQLIAADDRLFAITADGRVLCFGSQAPAGGVQRHALTGGERTGGPGREGYCMLWGIGDNAIARVRKLARQYFVIVIDPDPQKVAALRRRLDDEGLYGWRAQAICGDPAKTEFPPYLASRIIVGDLAAAPGRGAAFAEALFHPLRPFGGQAVLVGAGDKIELLAGWVKEAGLLGAKLSRSAGGGAVLTREGPLPGAGDWTHQYGDVANTVCSQDSLVKGPLGLLWFGGSSHMDVLPRHGHGPPEQVLGGRLFIEGLNCLSARDVYTGRVLWKRDIPNMNTFGVYYDRSHKLNPLDTSYNQLHLPGANSRGTNFVVTNDTIYVLSGSGCLRLDPATGKRLGEIRLGRAGRAKGAEWGYIGVYEDLLIVGVSMIDYPEDPELKGKRGFTSWDRTSSRRIVVMDRRTGRERWRVESKLGFRHNAIAAGGGKLFCIDMLPAAVAAKMKRNGVTPAGRAKLAAFDIRTGRPAWSTVENVFGTWLSYSGEHNLLIQGGRRSRDMLINEPDNRMIAHAADDGEVIWDKSFTYGGPPILNGRVLYTQEAARDLLTGEPLMRRHPLTGEEIPWGFVRNYGCNTAIASRHMLTFRSAAAGFYDLAADAGTANIGGFKSGCTSNLVPANGVLNAPDYTRTCTCSYQNQTSLALVHSPEMETWTFSNLPPPKRRIRRLGINLGAPGDRGASSGTLWLDYPSAGGPSPDPPIAVSPGGVKWFRRHSSRILSGRQGWVVASGAQGLRRLVVTVAPPSARGRASYTVGLYFAVGDGEAARRFVFDIAIAGKVVAKDVDVLKRAGGANRQLVLEFSDIKVGRQLEIELTPSSTTPGSNSILCGVEIVAQDPPRQ